MAATTAIAKISIPGARSGRRAYKQHVSDEFGISAALKKPSKDVCLIISLDKTDTMEGVRVRVHNYARSVNMKVKTRALEHNKLGVWRT